MTKRSADISEHELVKAWLTSDFLNFVAYFYPKLHGQKFVVNKHHRIIASALMDVVLGKTKQLIINIAPRYSKTELVSINFPAYCYALNAACNFIHTSYSADLTEKNSIAVKDIIKSEEFQKYFEARIKSGSDTKSAWDTSNGGGFYATSTLGQLTGFGAGATTELDDEGKFTFNGAIIIDDPIKPFDALSDTKRESVNEWFYNTLKSRVNSPKSTPIIIVMQRLHENDLCGYLLNKEPKLWKAVSLPCLTFNEEGEEEALWAFKHDVDALHAIQETNSYVFETQYQQNPKPIEGLMYREFKTYEVLPYKGMMKNYTDSADTGSDYLCSICYKECADGLYVTDVYYTQKTMDVTEQELPVMLMKNNVEHCTIESNNGGRVFMRNVERISREMHNYKTTFYPYTQTKNKEVRIFSNANEVNNLVIFPHNWKSRWREFANHVTSFRREGRNVHDDAEDVLTAMVERMIDANALSDSEIENIFS